MPAARAGSARVSAVQQDPAVRLAGIRAVLLDMDGTLVDSTPAVARAWIAFADDHGLDREQTVGLAVGLSSSATIRQLTPGLSGPAFARAVELQSEREADLTGVCVAPGALDLLSLIERRDLPWAVVTNADAGLARARLGRAGIRPPVLVTADDVLEAKPHPQGYLDAAKILGVSVDRCLVVEDSPVGARAGLAAGALVVGVVPGLGTPLTVRDLTHLRDLLAGC